MRAYSIYSCLLIVAFALSGCYTVRRTHSYDDVFRSQGCFYNDTLYFSEILIGNSSHPYAGDPVFSFITPANDTIGSDKLDMKWITLHLEEVKFPPKKDTVINERIREFYGLFSSDYIRTTTRGGAPASYLGWPTDSVRIFINYCWGLTVISKYDKPVAFHMLPSQSGWPGQEANVAKEKYMPCNERQLFFSNAKRMEFYQLPCTAAQLEKLFGKPQKQYKDAEVRALY